MRQREALELLREAVHGHTGTWADLGAGEGTFTRALAELLPGSRIYAIDHDARALRRLESRAAEARRDVITVAADFTQPLELPGLEEQLDGALLANALHYVADPGPTLARLAAMLRPGGRLVVIEYERRRANRWVPFPVSPERLSELAAGAGLSLPRITATQPSAYGGDLYVAVLDRSAMLRA